MCGRARDWMRITQHECVISIIVCDPKFSVYLLFVFFWVMFFVTDLQMEPVVDGEGRCDEDNKLSPNVLCFLFRFGSDYTGNPYTI